MTCRLAIGAVSRLAADVLPLSGTSRKRKTNGALYVEERWLRHPLKVGAILGECPLPNIALLTIVYGTVM
jgi:hypothetical protein